MNVDWLTRAWQCRRPRAQAFPAHMWCCDIITSGSHYQWLTQQEMKTYWLWGRRTKEGKFTIWTCIQDYQSSLLGTAGTHLLVNSWIDCVSQTFLSHSEYVISVSWIMTDKSLGLHVEFCSDGALLWFHCWLFWCDADESLRNFGRENMKSRYFHWNVHVELCTRLTGSNVHHKLAFHKQYEHAAEKSMHLMSVSLASGNVRWQPVASLLPLIWNIRDKKYKMPKADC